MAHINLEAHVTAKHSNRCTGSLGSHISMCIRYNDHGPGNDFQPQLKAASTD
jgi:hypothetical protein